MLVATELTDEFWYDELSNVPYLVDILDNFDGVYLAGGLIRSILGGEEVTPNKTDVDLFFRDVDSLEMVKRFIESQDEYKKIYQCPAGKLASYVYLDGDNELNGWKIQLITVDYYNSVEELIDSFDFTCTMFGTDGKILVMHEDALSDTVSKLLVWNKITYPASSLRRMMKYARKGYNMQESEFQLFVSKCWEHDVDIKDEQLVYVD